MKRKNIISNGTALNNGHWSLKPVRMLRRDYMYSMDDFKRLDLDDLARRKKEEWHINCEWVMGTLGFGGLAYQATFNSPAIEKHPPLGDFDVLREYAPFARKHGIKLIAYMNMHWFADEFAAKHRDWEQIMIDGKPYGEARPLYGDGRTLCVNTPWREWAFTAAREAMKTGIDGIFLDGPVVYPKSCYCPRCRKKFADAYAAELPVWADWKNPVWKKFLAFRERSLAEFLRDTRSAIRKVNKDGVVFLNAGNYGGGAWRVARNIEAMQEHQDFNGAEAFFHPGPRVHETFFSALSGKYLSSGEKPAVVFMHHCLGPWHALPLPCCEAQVGIAQTVASGANPWLAVMTYSAEASEEEALAPAKDMFGFLEANEEYFDNTASAANIALLFSRRTNTNYLSDLSGLYRESGSAVEQNLGVDQGGATIEELSKQKELCDNLHGQCFTGMFKALMREHIPFDVILDGALRKGLEKRYDLLILPNSACLSDEQTAAVLAFMKAGKGVIATFETGEYDENGTRRQTNKLLAALGAEKITGILPPAVSDEFMQVTGDHPVTKRQRRDGYLPRPVYNLTVKAAPRAAAPVQFLKPTMRVYSKIKGLSGNPALIIKENVGRSVYFSSLIGNFFNQYSLKETRSLISDAARWAMRDRTLARIDAPSSVSIELRRQSRPSRLLVHLVNNTGEMERPYDRIIAIENIKVAVRHAGRPKRVRTLRNRSSLKFSQAGGWVTFTVPKLEIYEVIVIE